MTVHLRSSNVVGFRSAPGNLGERAGAVAAAAALHADEVDREGRFPVEAIDVARSQGLMGLLTPMSLGGEGASIGEIAEICYTLGQSCASTGMIFAMHQVKVACVIRHGLNDPWRQGFIRRLLSEQLLIASSTTEGQGGGAVRSSEAPVLRHGERVSLERLASVISYGEEADAIVTTARRSAEATASDQVLAVFLKQDYSLERTLEWDTLGMRGTRSAGFTLRAEGEAAQVLDEPYENIHAQTMVPCAHLFWSAAWAGVAAGAVERARKYLRKAMRGGAEAPPGAAHYTKAASGLRALRALIAANLDRYEALQDDPAALSSMGFQQEISLLKVDASEVAVAVVLHALRACGLSGYRNDSEVSIGRHLRDILSSPIMINNDRILAGLGAAAVMADAHEAEELNAMSLAHTVDVHGHAAAGRLDLIDDGLCQPMGADGVYARGETYEQVILALMGLISRLRPAGSESLRFPPVMSRAHLERSGYLLSFPNLLGCVSCLHGGERQIRGAVQRFVDGGSWTASLDAADLVLTPAACYPVYPIISGRGPTPEDGLLFDVAADCFRREPSRDVDRLQSFRMREFVCVGAPEKILAFREAWLERAGDLARDLGLPHTIEVASDPFFGRGGQIMALSQVQQTLKFELLVPVRSLESPTACMSFNYHQDHFGEIWDIRDRAGDHVHTGCVAFGVDRLAVAMFAVHGVDPAGWPRPVRQFLGV